MGGILLNKNLLLAVGITILFLGISIQPAIAINPISYDNEDDCDICPKVNKLKELGKYQELSNKITTLKVMNKKHVSDLSWDFPIICNILYYIFGYQFITLMILIIIEDYYDNQIISSILRTWYAMKVMIVLPTMFILMILNCPQFPPNT